MRLAWVGAVMLAMQPGPAGASEVVLRLATIAPEGSPYAQVCEKGAELVRKNTHGAIRVRVFANGTLGTESEALRSAADGRIEVYAGAAATAHPYVPELEALELPYLFRGEREVELVLPRVWPAVRAAASARGWEALSYTAVGFRHLATRRPIATLAELRKVRIRSMSTPVYEQFWRRVGIPAVGAATPEVAPMFERGEIQGFDSPLTLLFASSWHDFVKQVMLTGHVFQPGVVLLSPRGAKMIPKAMRAGWVDGIERLGQENLHSSWAIERELAASLPKLGVAVVPMPTEIREAFEAEARLVREDWRKRATPAGRRVLDEIVRELARVRRN